MPSSRLFSTSCTAFLAVHLSSDAGRACACVVSSPKRVPLGTSALPQSDTTRHLGDQISLDRCLHFLPRRCGRHHSHYPFHAISANHLSSIRLFPLLRATRPLATHCNLSTLEVRHCLCPDTAKDSTRREADRTRSTLYFLTSFASAVTLPYTHRLLFARLKCCSISPLVPSDLVCLAL